jgi:Cof subfamily protein (haloacid dehalogenase superfamily)
MTDMRFIDTLLVCDMDKTLLNSQSKVSNRNRDALIRFTKNGGLFTIATGRMHEAVKPYVNELPINVPAILYNGSTIFDINKNEIVWQKCLNNEIIEVIEDVYNRFDDVGIQVYHAGQIYIAKGSIESDKHIIREQLKPIMCMLTEVPFPWIKILLACEHSRLKEVEAYLKDKPGNFRTVFSEPQFLEIVEAGVSKGSALNQLKNILGSADINTISVGDNLNDVELIKNADVGVAVGNAHPYIREIADVCCCHHDEDAVAQVIEWIEEGKIRSVGVQQS